MLIETKLSYLWGAATTTIGLLAGAFYFLRRRVDPLLLWLAAFAGLYGAHVVVEYQPLWSLGVEAPVLSRIGLAMGLLSPVPAFFFFDALGLLGRLGRILRDVVWPISATRALLTMIFGYIQLIDLANNILVVLALLILAFALLRVQRQDRDVATVRWGVLFFCACALYIARNLPHTTTSSLTAFSFCSPAWA